MKIFFYTFLIMMIVTPISVAKIKIVSFHDLIRKADFIVEGQVLKKTAQWDEKKIMIHTEYVIDVTERVNGNIPPHFSLRVAGGSVGEETITLTHSPQLKMGQRYILFCYADQKYSVPFVGHEQGIFLVIHDQVRNKAYIQDYHGYRIERTRNSDLIRGALTEINDEGELVVRRVLPAIRVITLPWPKVRSVKGELIAQDHTFSVPPQKRTASVPVTRSEFIRFIKYPPSNKEAKK